MSRVIASIDLSMRNTFTGYVDSIELIARNIPGLGMTAKYNSDISELFDAEDDFMDIANDILQEWEDYASEQGFYAYADSDSGMYFIERID